MEEKKQCIQDFLGDRPLAGWVVRQKVMQVGCSPNHLIIIIQRQPNFLELGLYTDCRAAPVIF